MRMDNPFPWMSKAMDHEGETNFFEIRVEAFAENIDLRVTQVQIDRDVGKCRKELRGFEPYERSELGE
jgi:hypothetical protein